MPVGPGQRADTPASNAPSNSTDGAVALFDWDNTLHDGWTLDGWVRWLVDRGLLSGEDQPEWDALKQRYLDGEITHSEFAIAGNEGYAEAIAGWSVDEMCALGAEFVRDSDRHTVYPWVFPLLRWLGAERGIRPTIVTGAPEALIAAHLDGLDVDVHALRLPTTEDGRRYLGSLGVNSGTDDGKHEIVERIKAAGRPVVLAAGDSSSDRPLFAAARRQLIVGAKRTLVEEYGGTALAVPDPSTATAGEMIGRVEQLLAS